VEGGVGYAVSVGVIKEVDDVVRESSGLGVHATEVMGDKLTGGGCV